MKPKNAILYDKYYPNEPFSVYDDIQCQVHNPE